MNINIKFTAGLLSLLLTCNTLADSSNSIEIEGYYLAVQSMAPIRAEFSQEYQDFVESTCDIKLTVNHLNLPAFQAIVTALEVSERMGKRGIESAELNGVVMARVMNSTDCLSFDATFDQFLNDAYITESYPKFAQFMKTYHAVFSAQ